MCSALLCIVSMAPNQGPLLTWALSSTSSTFTKHT